ncbi:MAG: hypothetical protein AAGH41_10095 [Pseudomonadota bacterium]
MLNLPVFRIASALALGFAALFPEWGPQVASALHAGAPQSAALFGAGALLIAPAFRR